MEVLKELGDIQIFMRDFPGYHETKSKIFTENSSVASNWMGYATSAYLNGDPDLALQIISKYIENMVKSIFFFPFI